MAEVKKLVLIEFTPAQMFELVDHCEDYPKFLPWCGGVDLLERSESTTAARLHVNFRGIKTHFSTENSKRWPSEMKLRLTEGPFTHLDGRWTFTALGEQACKVEFQLRYQFSSKLLEKVLGPVFNHIATTFIDSFVKRAGEVYARA